MSYKECYVAFIDILGFSNYVRSHTFDEVYSMLSHLKVEQNAANSGVALMYRIPLNSMKIIIVSDSIILSIEKDVDKSLEAIVWLCSCFQAALLLNSGMIMRGAISCGEFYIEDTILFGEAYLNAVELEKKYTMPRIILDEIIDATKIKDRTFIAKDKIDNVIFVDFMKSVKKVSCVSWKLPNVKKSIIEKLKYFKNRDEFIFTKYDWLKDYYNSSLTIGNGFKQFEITQEELQ